LSLHAIDISYPYIAFTVIAFIGAIDGVFLRYESKGQNLDSLETDVEEKISIN
jgi:hypothetical protein